MKDYGISESDFLRAILDGTLTDDDTSKKIIYCFSFGAGLVEKDGHLVISKMSKLMGDHPLLEQFQETLRNCNTITKENPYETTFAMNFCINNNSPLVFSV